VGLGQVWSDFSEVVIEEAEGESCLGCTDWIWDGRCERLDEVVNSGFEAVSQWLGDWMDGAAGS
jgi:hypothetical protein